MPKIDLEESVRSLGNKMENDYYNQDHALDYDDGYSKEKEDRDTKAVKDFLKSDFYKYINDNL